MKYRLIMNPSSRSGKGRLLWEKCLAQLNASNVDYETFISESIEQCTSLAQEKGEETYTISLTQTAEIDKEFVEIDDKKVLTERYTVQRGDHLWKILRKRKLLNKKQLPDIISILKQLNSDLGNLDLIHPGQTIIIPLIISPAKGMPVAPTQVPPKPKAVSIKDVEVMDLESYTVKSGDSLIKVILDRYDIPKEHLHELWPTVAVRHSLTNRDTASGQ